MSTIEVAAGLIFRDGKILIAQRPADVHVGGLWEFPGGKRECEESFESCLARELKEELGIDVQVHGLVESITHTYPDRSVKLNFYRCSVIQGEPSSLGCAAFCWVGPEDLDRYVFPAADARLLEKLRTTPSLWQ